MMEYGKLSGREVRALCRSGEWTKPTPGLALGYAQANLVIVPQEAAFEFLLFCQRNPKPCPLLDVTDVGSPEPKWLASGADIRVDLPAYRIFRNGELIAEPTELREQWRDDFVGFLIGCSFTFESALLEAGVPIRHIEQGVNVPMYRTNRPCRSAGRFNGPLVVSMRPMTSKEAIRAVQVCSQFPRVHGAPIHLGDPSELGIKDIDTPDFGDPVEIRAGEIPVFWACGVTPQSVAMASRPTMLITHKPGHMFVGDRRDIELAGE